MLRPALTPPLPFNPLVASPLTKSHLNPISDPASILLSSPCSLLHTPSFRSVSLGLDRHQSQYYNQHHNKYQLLIYPKVIYKPTEGWTIFSGHPFRSSVLKFQEPLIIPLHERGTDSTFPSPYSDFPWSRPLFIEVGSDRIRILSSAELH